MKPHQQQTWINLVIEDEETFKKGLKGIFEIYTTIEELSEENVHVYSVDEKMGIAAREHMNPKQQMKPGVSERIDPEYKRHGTTGIIASLNVATGEIVNPLVQPTRKEVDFLAHIEGVVRLNEFDKNIFLVDNLNTHVSESLVKMVAEYEGLDLEELGEKGKSGILKNKDSRRDFLEQSEHKIQFMYTPKHCSWLNQIECWFSIITRSLLNRRLSVISVEDLESKIHKFINYYNEFMKKPFDWSKPKNFLRFDLYFGSK